MTTNGILTVISLVVGVTLGYTPSKKYSLFNAIMEFLGSGGLYL